MPRLKWSGGRPQAGGARVFVEFFTSSLNKRRKLEGDAEEDGAGGGGGGPRKIERGGCVKSQDTEFLNQMLTQSRNLSAMATHRPAFFRLNSWRRRPSAASSQAKARAAESIFYLLGGPFMKEVRSQGQKLAQVREVA